jgi:two-component system chemotaxis response regulator CheB
VKQLGGIAVVQDPTDAIAPSMPQNALDHVRVDHCLPLARIPELLMRLAREDIVAQGGYAAPEPMEIEVNIAKEVQPLQAGVTSLGDPSCYACPECHGVLLEVREGGRARFRCHTGHAFSSESLIAEFDDAIEAALWNSVRALQEKGIFLRHLAAHAGKRADSTAANAYIGSANEADRRAAVVRRITLEGTGDAARDAAD